MQLKKLYSFDSSIGVDYATLPMTGIGKPKFIFVWLVWVAMCRSELCVEHIWLKATKPYLIGLQG